MKKRKNSAEVVDLLDEIYEEKFGGKNRGRFLVSREEFRTLSGREKLQDAFIAKVIYEAYEQGYVVADLEDEFAVVEENVMRKYRKVPESIIREILFEDEEEDEDGGTHLLVEIDDEEEDELKLVCENLRKKG